MCSLACSASPHVPSPSISWRTLGRRGWKLRCRCDVAPFVDRRCKPPISEIQAAVDGAVSHEQAVKLRQCLDHIDELEKHRSKIEAEINCLVSPFTTTLDLIHTVPGFKGNPLTAITVVSEIGVDMSVFPSSKNLVSWAGCCPRNDKSNKTVKSTRISKAGDRKSVV